jgi:hypothetical protein
MQVVAKDGDGKSWRCNLYDTSANNNQQVIVEVCGPTERTLTVRRSDLQEYAGQDVENPPQKIR